ncbi:MAG: hypothetical protein ACI35T_01675 [Alistipes sp.]
MTGWIVFAVFVVLIAGEALRRGVCRYSGNIAHIVGRWRVEDAENGFDIYFDKTYVGYFEYSDRIETFSFAVVGKRIVMERDCRKTRYRYELHGDSLVMSDGVESLRFVRVE